MAIKFWTYLETDKYNIGLSSKTIYIYDKEGNEIIKFKDLSYGYMGCVSNNQELLVVKSSEGRIAIYSLEKLELIKKFRFSKVDGSQDDNFIFSPDDKYFFNIERHVSSTKTALSIYDTKDFTLHKRLLNDNDNLVISVIEYDKEYPQYEFAKNKGYGTKEHLLALDTLGITPIHRKTYEPVKTMLLPTLF